MEINEVGGAGIKEMAKRRGDVVLPSPGKVFRSTNDVAVKKICPTAVLTDLTALEKNNYLSIYFLSTCKTYQKLYFFKK